MDNLLRAILSQRDDIKEDEKQSLICEVEFN